MPETAARLLSLLSLLQTPRLWPGSELAERLGVTGRTVRREVGRLRDLGYPANAEQGGHGGYRLVAGTAMPPLLLEDDEAVAVGLGLRLDTSHGVRGQEEAALRALGKLLQVLPPRLRRRVDSLAVATISHPFSAAATERVDPDVLVVAAADLRPLGTSSPRRWSASAGGGSCSPTTSTAWTGGPSALTASASPAPPAPGPSPERFPEATLRRSSHTAPKPWPRCTSPTS